MLRITKLTLWIIVLLVILFVGAISPGRVNVFAQQPTGSVPTVTGTASGPTVTVDISLQQVTVYAGPGSFDYPAVGVLLGNESAPALGRARGRDDWIQIYYAGVPGSVAWVYALYVKLSPGALLPVIDVPLTPTPFSTPTLNPTLEAAFIGQQTPTRLPTFTPPPPLDLPSFNDSNSAENSWSTYGIVNPQPGVIRIFWCCHFLLARQVTKKTGYPVFFVTCKYFSCCKSRNRRRRRNCFRHGNDLEHLGYLLRSPRREPGH